MFLILELAPPGLGPLAILPAGGHNRAYLEQVLDVREVAAQVGAEGEGVARDDVGHLLQREASPQEEGHLHTRGGASRGARQPDTEREGTHQIRNR
jgi:hypothetical protein